VRIRTCLSFLLITLCAVFPAWAQWEGAEMTRLTFNHYQNGMARQSLCIDNCDRLYLFYGGGDVLFTSKSKYGDWAAPQRVSFGDGKRYSYAMALNPVTGAINAVLIRYFSITLPDFGELYVGSNVGGTWEFTRIDSSAYGGYGGRSPAMAIDSLGNVHVVWIATYYDTCISYYRSRVVYSVNANGEWATQVVYSSPGEYNGIKPWIEVERDGIAHIMWQMGSLYHLENDGLGGVMWTLDVLSQGPVEYWEFVDLRVDQNDNLHMAIEGIDYWGGPRYLYYYLRSAASTVWANPELVCDHGCFSSIGFDSQGRAHLLWSLAAGNFCGLGLGYSVRADTGWCSWEIVGENYDYEYTIEPMWLGFALDSDLNGHTVFAACEGLPLLADSIEIFDYSTPYRFDIGHAVCLLNYLFRDGPAPYCKRTYDLDCDDCVTIFDVIILLNYLFRGGSLSCR
jgi:hypothetical protein